MYSCFTKIEQTRRASRNVNKIPLLEYKKEYSSMQLWCFGVKKGF